MSERKPWQVRERSDTLEPERRVRQPKRSDEIVSQAVSLAGVPSRRPGLAETLATWRVLIEGRRMRGLTEEELAALVHAQRPAILARGFRGRPLALAAAAIREMTFRKRGMRHHPVQVMGGLSLLGGQIVEMATGEGKTITTLIPAVFAALTGTPVHVVTVNDYLAERDCETLRPVIEAFGLTVGLIRPDTDFALRPDIYRRDVVFATNKDVAFDYLRDRIALAGSTTALSTLAARLLSQDAGAPPVNMVRGLGFAIVDEVDSILIDEAQTPLIITAETGGGDEVALLVLGLARDFREGEHFRINRTRRSIMLLPEGDLVIEAWRPLAPELLPLAARRERVVQALSALHLYLRDEHYVVTEEGVAIVDEFTGRIMADRQWQRGLHQLIETKENVEPSAPRQTTGQITYQTFFGRYRWFGGMTGTAREVSRELSLSHGRRVLRLPTHRRPRRRHRPTRFFGSASRRWNAVLAEVRRVAGAGRPVLVGTRSVEASEQLASLLRKAGLETTVLNARQDADEAAIIARAGEAGRITVATNMAGRGTDIPVPHEVERRGGLHVVLTEFHASARIDRQFFGRAGRQGQRGSAIAIVSLEDDLFRSQIPLAARLVRGLSLGWTGRLPGWVAGVLRLLAQAAAERRGRSRRGQTVRRARQMEKSLGFRPDGI